MRRFSAGVLGRLLFLFPVFWVGGMVGFALTRCAGLHVKQCIEMAATAPVLAVLPAIVHDEEPPIELPHLEIFCVAVAAAIVWEYASSRKCRRY